VRPRWPASTSESNLARAIQRTHVQMGMGLNMGGMAESARKGLRGHDRETHRWSIKAVSSWRSARSSWLVAGVFLLRTMPVDASRISRYESDRLNRSLPTARRPSRRGPGDYPLVTQFLAVPEGESVRGAVDVQLVPSLRDLPGRDRSLLGRAPACSSTLDADSKPAARRCKTRLARTPPAWRCYQ